MLESDVERRERAILVGLRRGKTVFGLAAAEDEPLEELAGLVVAAGGDVVFRMTQERSSPDPRGYLGRGKVAELAQTCAAYHADVVVVDDELTPAQQRHLEDDVHTRVVDRTEVILDIFARRARTREGRLQVELAQLKYQLPRLAGSSSALSRLGGGIGTRGPGETKLETDRRRIRARLKSLADEIERVRQRRSQLRERRQKTAVPTVALVGYTNAGKTTLFNTLTRTGAEASNALFVTLDPLARNIRLPDRREVLLSDTVGFIDRLPHTLVAAFRATLEEVIAADLLLHVVDASAPDLDRRRQAVERVLDEVGAREVPALLVYNKRDRIDGETRDRLERAEPDSLCISAITRDGLDRLLAEVTRRVGADVLLVRLTFDVDDPKGQAQLAELHRKGRVLEHQVTGSRASVLAEVPRSLATRLTHAAR